MKKLLGTVAAGLGLVAMAGGASADPITFQFQDLSGSPADLPTNMDNATSNGTCNGTTVSSTEDLCTDDFVEGFDYLVDGVSVNVTAYNSDGSTALLQDLRPNNSGLAVITVDDSSQDDQIQFDTGESVIFDFGMNVELVGMDFNAGHDKDCSSSSLPEGPCGKFDLIVDNAFSGSYSALDDLILGGIFGSVFQVVATTEGGGFAIGSITVNKVPEPGTLALLGLGLVGIGAVRRRRNLAS